MDRRGMEGLVGRGAAVPYPCLRAYPSRQALDRNEGRHHFPLHRRQPGGGAGGGPATICEFLAADLIDHMHLALVPIILGRGESLWDGLGGLEERFAIES